MYAFYMCSCCMRITGEGIWNGVVSGIIRLSKERASFYAIYMPPITLCHYEYLLRATTFFSFLPLEALLLHAYGHMCLQQCSVLRLPPIGLHGSSPSVAATQRRSPSKLLTPLLRAAATADSRFMSLHRVNRGQVRCQVDLVHYP